MTQRAAKNEPETPRFFLRLPEQQRTKRFVAVCGLLLLRLLGSGKQQQKNDEVKKKTPFTSCYSKEGKIAKKKKTCVL